jgi:hypothetical protein
MRSKRPFEEFARLVIPADLDRRIGPVQDRHEVVDGNRHSQGLELAGNRDKG